MACARAEAAADERAPACAASGRGRRAMGVFGEGVGCSSSFPIRQAALDPANFDPLELASKA